MAGEESKKILTVSVAAYNAQDYLEEVLDSLTTLPQMSMLEVFVVDDGGTDSSLEIAKKYEKEYPGSFHAVHKENGGWGSTVNYSISHASGKYFKILDGDDYFSKENFASFVEYLQTSNSDIVISPYTTFDDVTHEILQTVSPDKEFEEGHVYKLAEKKGYFPLSMHAFAVKTKLLQENNVRLKEHCLYRDMEFTANALTYADSFSVFNQPIYYYRLGRAGQSVEKASYLKHIDEHADIVYDILAASELDRNKSKKQLIYDLAKDACSHQYNIYFYTAKTKDVKKKLIEFDKRIRKYPEFYKSVYSASYIKALKKVRFHGYHLVMSLLFVRRKLKKQH